MFKGMSIEQNLSKFWTFPYFQPLLSSVLTKRRLGPDPPFLKKCPYTVALKDHHETKNGTAVLSMGFQRETDTKQYITGIKIFRWALLKIFELENFKSQYKKYLTSEKYLEDHRRCKIKFRTTFVFCIKLIFPLLLELENVEKRAKIFFSKYFLKFSMLSNSKRSGKINLV